MSVGRSRKIKVQKGEGLWLLSFSDLSMILIAFFILMLSYSKPDKKKVENVQSAMTQKETPKSNAKTGEAPPRALNNLQELQEKINQEVKKRGLEASAKVTYDVDGLSIEFKDSLLFSSGSADANPQFENVVGSVMNVIAGVPKRYHLIFEGHTDDTPMAGGPYPSNWELSASRAITLMRQFERRGVKKQNMSITAYADTKPKIKPSGLSGKSLQEARAANRRVVIRIE